MRGFKRTRGIRLCVQKYRKRGSQNFRHVRIRIDDLLYNCSYVKRAFSTREKIWTNLIFEREEIFNIISSVDFIDWKYQLRSIPSHWLREKKILPYISACIVFQFFYFPISVQRRNIIPRSWSKNHIMIDHEFMTFNGIRFGSDFDYYIV